MAWKPENYSVHPYECCHKTTALKLDDERIPRALAALSLAAAAAAAPAGGPLAPGQSPPASHHHAAHLIHHDDLPTAHLPAAEWARAEPFALNQTRLLAGSVYSEAQQLNSDYLGVLDLDRLLYQFRFFAGLPQPSGARPYGGWESPTYQVRMRHYSSFGRCCRSVESARLSAVRVLSSGAC